MCVTLIQVLMLKISTFQKIKALFGEENLPVYCDIFDAKQLHSTNFDKI